MDPAHRHERMEEANATYRVISRRLRWASCRTEKAAEEPEEKLSWRRSGVRAEAIAWVEGRPVQINDLYDIVIDSRRNDAFRKGRLKYLSGLTMRFGELFELTADPNRNR